MGNIVYELSGWNQWFILHETLGGFCVFMNNQYQAEFANQDVAEKYIEDCENEKEACQ